MEIGENLLTFFGEMFVLAIIGMSLYYKYKVKKLSTRHEEDKEKDFKK